MTSSLSRKIIAWLLLCSVVLMCAYFFLAEYGLLEKSPRYAPTSSSVLGSSQAKQTESEPSPDLSPARSPLAALQACEAMSGRSDIEEDYLCRYDSNVFHLLDATKHQQYRRFRAVAPTFKFKAKKMRVDKNNKKKKAFQTPNPPRYDVRIQEHKGYILLSLQEVYRHGSTNVSSQGGSSLFGLVTTSCNQTLCAYKDYFDGNYSMLCPVFSPKVHIKVTVLQIEYEQFRSSFKSVDIVLLDREFTTNDSLLLSELPEQVTMKWSCRKSDSKSMCGILSQYDRVYMVGSSHMRYEFFHIINVCSGHVADIRKRLYHVDASYGMDLADALASFVDDTTPDDCNSDTFHSNILSHSQISKRFKFDVKPTDQLQMFVFRQSLLALNRDVISPRASNDTDKMRVCLSEPSKKVAILAQTGSWDLSFIGIEKSLNETIPAIDSILQRFSSMHSAKTHVTFLLTSPPPFNPKYYAFGRSNDEIQLYSSALEAAAEKYKGVGFFSTFNAMYPAYWDNVDSHYLRCYTGKAECKGQHGKIVLQDALQALDTYAKSRRLT